MFWLVALLIPLGLYLVAVGLFTFAWGLSEFLRQLLFGSHDPWEE